MLFFAFFSSIYTFYINKKWYFRNLLSKIPFCQQSERTSSEVLYFLSVVSAFLGEVILSINSVICLLNIKHIIAIMAMPQPI